MKNSLLRSWNSRQARFERLEVRQLLAGDALYALLEDGSSISSLADVYIDESGQSQVDIDLEDRKAITDQVYFVDDVAANGTGTSASPFNDISVALTTLKNSNLDAATVIVQPGLYTWGRMNALGFDLNIIGSGTGSDSNEATIVRHVANSDPDNLYAAQFRQGSTYIEGISFDGQGTAQSVLDVRNAQDLTIVDSEITGSGERDGANILNIGTVVVYGTSVHHNEKDGLSYATTETGGTMEILEVDVHAYENGQDGLWNSQGSTIHKAANIVRVGGIYESNPTNISDVSQTTSWNVDIVTRDAQDNAQDEQYLNYNISGGGLGWIIGGDHSQGVFGSTVVNAQPEAEIRYVSHFNTLDPTTHTVVGTATIDDSPLVLVTPPPPPTPQHDISIDGDSVVASATDADDVVELTLGSEVHTLSISGTEYTFDATIIHHFTIDGGSGNDAVVVHGTSLNDRVHLIEDRGRLTSTDYEVHTSGFSNSHFVGHGGTDYAELFGSDTDDQLAALPRESTLTTPFFVLHASDIDRIDSYGRGGIDYASMYGTLGDDLYFTRSDYALMTGGGVTTFTKEFERVDAFGRAGNDRAMLYDSPLTDLFVALPTYAYLTNGIRVSYTKGFERVDGYSDSGGSDRAVFYDDVSKTEQFTSRPNYAYMSNSDFLNYAAGFSRVDAISDGGNDSAFLREATSQSILTGQAALLTLSNNDASRHHSVSGFAMVTAEAEADESPIANVGQIDIALQLVGVWI